MPAGLDKNPAPLNAHFCSPLAGYAMSLALLPAAVAVRMALGMHVTGAFPFLFFYPAIAFSAYFGGVGPGLTAMLGTGLFGAFVASPPPGGANWILLALIGFHLIAGAAWVRRLRDDSAAVAAESARLRFVVEHVSDWIFLADGEGRIEYLNQTACDQLRLSPGQLLGHSVEELDAEPEQQAIRELVERARAGSVPPREILLRRGDGSSILAEVSCTAIRTRGTQVVHLAARDVTDRKLIDRKLREALQWESLGALTGGLAHDFNNLLTTIMGNASLAREMVPPQNPVAPLIGAVEESGERCAELIRMMLATSGYRPRGMATLRVDEMVRGIAAAAEKTAPPGIRVEVQACACTFESDRGTIDTLLRGLISNAIESYGPEPGDVTVTVGFAEAPEPGRKSFEEGLARDGEYLCIAVEDHGCGMSAEVAERAFNPFFSTKFTGRGLGLPAVRGIVRAHDGLLRMQTGQGAGTRVEVWLPIESYHQSARHQSAHKRPV